MTTNIHSTLYRDRNYDLQACGGSALEEHVGPIVKTLAGARVFYGCAHCRGLLNITEKPVTLDAPQLLAKTHREMAFALALDPGKSVPVLELLIKTLWNYGYDAVFDDGASARNALRSVREATEL